MAEVAAFSPLIGASAAVALHRGRSIRSRPREWKSWSTSCAKTTPSWLLLTTCHRSDKRKTMSSAGSA